MTNRRQREGGGASGDHFISEHSHLCSGHFVQIGSAGFSFFNPFLINNSQQRTVRLKGGAPAQKNIYLYPPANQEGVFFQSVT